MRSFNNQAQPKSDVLLNLMYNPNDRFIKFGGQYITKVSRYIKF